MCRVGGGLGAVPCVLTLGFQVSHPTVDRGEPDPECALDSVPGQARRADLRVVLSNSFGLGGQNACLVIKKLTINN